jgi:AcrR family transcriptional regulator
MPLRILDDTAPAQPRRDARENRQRILDAARTMLLQGARTICMDELAEIAGVGKGTLYRRFSDKRALFFAILDDDERALQEFVQQGCGAKNASHRCRLDALWRALVAFAVLHREALRMSDADRVPGAWLEAAPWRWRSIELQRHLRHVVVGVDVEFVAETLLASLQPHLVSRVVDRCGESARARLESLLLAHTG